MTYYSQHKEDRKEYGLAYYQAHKEERKAYSRRNWRKNHPKKEKKSKEEIQISIKESRKAYAKKNRDKETARVLKWQKRHPISTRPLQNRIAHRLRVRIRSALHNMAKVGSAVKDLGCSIEEFKNYIESKFKEGMSWANWGMKGWHLDHIKPLSSFNLLDRDQFLKACNYKNLQPLWWYENFRKGKCQ